MHARVSTEGVYGAFQVGLCSVAHDQALSLASEPRLSWRCWLQGAAWESAFLSEAAKASAQDCTGKARQTGTLPVPLLHHFLRTRASGSGSLQTAAQEDVTRRRLESFLKLEGDAVGVQCSPRL